MKTIFRAAAGLAAALAVQSVHADTTLVFVDQGDGESQSARTEIANGLVRMSTPGEAAYMVFDSNKSTFTAIDPNRRSYIVFDRAQIDKIVNMQKQMMAQMEAQLQSLPAAQREQMKQMMASRMPQMGGPKEERRYVRTGESRTVSKWDCDVLEVYVGDRKNSEQCVVERGELDIPDEDYESFGRMRDFMVEVAESLSQMTGEFPDFGEPGHDEIPVQYIQYSERSSADRGQLSAIETGDIDPARFEIPAGFKEEKIPDLF